MLIERLYSDNLRNYERILDRQKFNQKEKTNNVTINNSKASTSSDKTDNNNEDSRQTIDISKYTILDRLTANKGIFIKILENYKEYADIMADRTAVKLGMLNELNLISEFLSYSSIFINVLGALLPDIKVQVETIFPNIKQLLMPIKMTPQTVKSNVNYYSFGNYINESKVRYLPHWSYRFLLNLNKTTSQIDPDLCKITDVFIKLFRKVSLQNRFSTIHGQIFSSLFVSQCQHEGDYLSGLEPISSELGLCNKIKYSTDTICYKVILYIISYYNGLPFYAKKRGISEEIFIRDDSDLPLTLPLILSSLLNGFSEEILGNMREADAIIFVKNLIWMVTKESITQAQMTMKKMVTPMFKYITKDLDGMPFIQRTTTGVALEVKYKRPFKEFMNVGELDEIMKIYLTVPLHLRDYIDKLKSILLSLNHKCNGLKLHSIKSANIDLSESSIKLLACYLEMLRYTYMVLKTVVNTGIFHKTFLELDFNKSTGTKVVTQIKNVNLKEEISIDNDIVPVKYDWLDHANFGKLYIQYCSNYKPVISKELIDRRPNFERFFVFNLTNRSGGVKVEDDTLPDALKNISNTRLISFLLERGSYYDLTKFGEMLSRVGKCSVRYQTERRGRIIVIVPNSYQTGDIFVLFAFNCIKKDKNAGRSMAVGKQVGGILDALSQLISSGSHNLIKDSTDISGMDAHTLPIVTKFIRYLVLESMLENTNLKNESYFTGLNLEAKVVEYFDRYSLPTIHTRRVDSASSHFALVLSKFYPLDIQLPSNASLSNLRISDQTFWSGLFGTSSQHTMFLDLLLRSTYQEFKTTLKPVDIFNMDRGIMGDDIRAEIEASSEQIVHDWVAFEKERFKDFNYEIEPDLSYIVSQFLQQIAICGLYVPLPSRVSLYCDEKSETLFRHPIDICKIILDIILTKAQRSYAPDNARSFGFAYWQLLRTHRLNIFPSMKSDINILKKSTSDLNFITELSDNVIQISYPYFLITTRPTNWPFPDIIIERKQTSPALSPPQDIHYFGTSMTSLQGSSSFMHLNLLFGKDSTTGTISRSFKVQSSNQINEKHKQASSVFFNNIDWDLRHKFGFSLSILLNDYHRIRHLSDLRKEELGVDVDVMISNLSTYLDQKLLRDSRVAFNLLRESGIKIPESLAYFSLAAKKVDQSLVSRIESLDETGALDQKFLRYLVIYDSKKLLRDQLLEEELAGIFFDLNSNQGERIELDLDKRINSYFPVMPGYHRQSSFGELYAYFGFPESSDLVRPAVNEITASMGANFDIDSAIDFGIHLNTIAPKFMDVLCTALGLSEDSSLAFKKLVDYYSTYGFRTRYQSIYKPMTHFAISGDIMKTVKMISTVNLQFYNNYSKSMPSNLYQAWIRDLVFMYVHLLHGKKVSFNISSYALFRSGIRSTKATCDFTFYHNLYSKHSLLYEE
ncbi:RNA-dependent RNA polymerase [Diaphorina citri reovirus]|nr:RNA-dependent RNA polymerase [Diaphorina citri reovirus]